MRCTPESASPVINVVCNRAVDRACHTGISCVISEVISVVPAAYAFQMLVVDVVVIHTTLRADLGLGAVGDGTPAGARLFVLEDSALCQR